MTGKEVEYLESRIRSMKWRLPHYVYKRRAAFTIAGATTTDPVPFAEIANLAFEPMHVGDQWGVQWESAWFRLKGTVPADWAGSRVVARINLGGEACVFSRAGNPVQGLTNGSIFANDAVRERYELFETAQGGETVELLVEAAANQLFGTQQDAHPIPGKAPCPEGSFAARIECAELAEYDEPAFQFSLDVALLFQLMKDLDRQSAHHRQILHALVTASDAFNYDQPDFPALRAILAPELARHASGAALHTRAVGHAHIDTAWLWPVRETIRKCARTYSSQLRLTEKYPGYVFGASAPQHYQFVKDHYPALFEEIRQAVADGRWECQGAMWVEADTNVPSGESLVRQLLYGKRFFGQEFGVDVRNLWIPDVFGYSAALPQLLLKAGVEFFVTQKLSWSQFNKFPHNTFRWRGLDGSEVITHFPPENNYNSRVTPNGLRNAQKNFVEGGFVDEFLTLFGIGDGGGGPREEEIEAALRTADLADCPKVQVGPAQEMLERLRPLASELAVWQGELYLELHRGTLTTQARNKQMNRDCELALRRAELLCACLPAAAYPHAAFERLWKVVLLNQFHDIIPGSSINRVYEDSQQEYRDVLQELDRIETEALVELRTPQTGDRALTLVNTLSVEFDGAVHVAALDSGALEAPDGERYPVQPAACGGGWIAPSLPGETTLVLRPVVEETDEFPAESAVTAAENLLENAFVRYEFSADGTLVRVFDKRLDREFMRSGDEGNRLILYQDWPARWDAWDVDLNYENQRIADATLESVTVLDPGPVLGSLDLRWKIGQSTVNQVVRLAANSARLDFITYVDWRESRKMLRVAFPVDVAAERASYEIQYGLVRRPTHRNTLWDKAMFEVCGHRFADLSDPSGGVALLNDCKYGYKVHERTLDLNLLRSSYYPDPHADRGEHRFTYSLLPHEDTVENSEVLAEAHTLNQPPLVCEGALELDLPCRVLAGEVVIDCVKRAEDGDALVIRVYEPFGTPTQARLGIDPAYACVKTANLLEEPGETLTLHEDSLVLEFRPFEVKTLLLRTDMGPPSPSSAPQCVEATPSTTP